MKDTHYLIQVEMKKGEIYFFENEQSIVMKYQIIIKKILKFYENYLQKALIALS